MRMNMGNADISAFLKKWNNKTLQDDGCYVSKEYKSFQTAFINAMKKIASSLGGEVVNTHKGHYDISGFIKVNGKFVYFSYDTSLCPGGRTRIILRTKTTQECWMYPLLIRSAKGERDYTGGYNQYASVEDCEEAMRRILSE